MRIGDPHVRPNGKKRWAFALGVLLFCGLLLCGAVISPTLGRLFPASLAMAIERANQSLFSGGAAHVAEAQLETRLRYSKERRRLRHVATPPELPHRARRFIPRREITLPPEGFETPPFDGEELVSLGAASLFEEPMLAAEGRIGSPPSFGPVGIIDIGGSSSSGGGNFPSPSGEIPLDSIPPAVPEPSTWITMILGFGLVGWSLRRNRGAGSISAEQRIERQPSGHTARTDLHPGFWTVLSWKIPVMNGGPEYGVCDEEIEFF